jgi:multidrug efflux pump subunit AcrA (membrane-fusion protein)
MVKLVNTVITTVCLLVLLVSGIGCAAKTSSPALEKQVAIVQRGNLAVTVSVDGNLVMPQAYNLLFGAPGNVQDVFVEEGDFVKEGTVLATLDNTGEKLGVESANNNVQQVLSKLYETVPLLPQFRKSSYSYIIDAWGNVKTDIHGNPVLHEEPDGFAWVPNPDYDPGDPESRPYVYKQVWLPGTYSYYYPNATALVSFQWAQDEVSNAHQLYQSDNYTAAASELYVALSDLEACVQIFEDTLNNPKSGLGNISPFIKEDEPLSYTLWYNTPAVIYIRELRQLVASIKQGQSDIETVRGLITQGEYDQVTPLFEELLKRVDDIGKGVVQNINVIKEYNYLTIYGEDISLYFYGAAAEKLNAALKGIETGGLNAPELHDNLRIAEHYMRICNAILGSNDYVLQHGLSLKNERQYNVDLQNALIGLGNSQQDFLNTVILAPFDGTVVSVGVKKNDVLSAMDYASKTAVQLVDTSQIKFTGLVDEIDILKIETGQKVMISVDAVSDKKFAGTVSFISPYGSKGTGSVVKFVVTIKLDDTTDVEKLKGGLTATADIIISSVEKALLVPLSAVTTTSEGSFVTIVNEATGQQEKRQVTLGSQSSQFAEVLSGLKEGDKVVIQEKVTGAPVVTSFPRGGGGPPGR